MDDPTRAYLDELRGYLFRRMPSEQIDSVLGETASHLSDLEEELGSPQAAVAKFGDARRFARKILREATAIPNPWRASILPFGVATAVELFFLLLPVRVFEAWVTPAGPFQPLTLILVGSCALILIGFFRARQVLWKPLLAFGAIHLFLLAVVFSGIAIPIPGMKTYAIERGSGLPEFQQSMGRQLSELRGIERQLKTGIPLFAKAKSVADIPTTFQFSDSSFTNPETLGATVILEDQAEQEQYLPSLLFFPEEHSMGGGLPSLSAASAAWKRDGERVLRQVTASADRIDQALAAAPAAMRQPWWAVYAGNLTRAFR